MKESHSLASWINISADCDFSIHNFPFGVYIASSGFPHCCSAIGDFIVDLDALAGKGYFSDIQLPDNIFKRESLNDFISLGKSYTNKVRTRLIELFSKSNDELQFNRDHHSSVLTRREKAQMLLPVRIGDYTDFYSSIEHATNVGAMFRDPANALLPNWKHLPVAYHGRASSIVVSGTPLNRPKGQFKRNKEDLAPVFGSTEALDFELEIGFVIGKNSTLGNAIAIEEAEQYIFGFLLFNDWSARDIQSWEYVPLGPFLSKNFMSSVSPWIVTAEALEPFRAQGPQQDVKVLPYLQTEGERNYDIELEVLIRPENGGLESISRTNFKQMYWNVAQQLAHHTINGCNVNVGDIMASGTISGPARENSGCLLELTRNGKEPIKLLNGTVRKYLDDGDTVVMTGVARRNGIRVGFGEVTGTVMPSV